MPSPEQAVSIRRGLRSDTVHALDSVVGRNPTVFEELLERARLVGEVLGPKDYMVVGSFPSDIDPEDIPAHIQAMVHSASSRGGMIHFSEPAYTKGSRSESLALAVTEAIGEESTRLLDFYVLYEEGGLSARATIHREGLGVDVFVSAREYLHFREDPDRSQVWHAWLRGRARQGESVSVWYAGQRDLDEQLLVQFIYEEADELH